MKRVVPFAAGLVFSTIAVAAVDMKPGLWEISVSTEMPGMPPMPPTKFQHCYQAGDMKDPRKVIPEKDPSCKVSDVKESGHTVRWKVACSGHMPYTASGTLTYSGESYSGTSTMTMNHGGKSMDMPQKMSGRRIGDCK